MLAARALARVAASKASPLASALQRSSAALEPTSAWGGAAAWRSVFSLNEGPKWLGAGPWTDREDKERVGDRRLHTGRLPLSDAEDPSGCGVGGAESAPEGLLVGCAGSLAYCLSL
jgi:hypothetical protein